MQSRAGAATLTLHHISHRYSLVLENAIKLGPLTDNMNWNEIFITCLVENIGLNSAQLYHWKLKSEYHILLRIFLKEINLYIYIRKPVIRTPIKRYIQFSDLYISFMFFFILFLIYLFVYFLDLNVKSKTFPDQCITGSCTKKIIGWYNGMKPKSRTYNSCLSCTLSCTCIFSPLQWNFIWFTGFLEELFTAFAIYYCLIHFM